MVIYVNGFKDMKLDVGSIFCFENQRYLVIETNEEENTVLCCDNQGDEITFYCGVDDIEGIFRLRVNDMTIDP